MTAAEVESAFQPLRGRYAWGASVGREELLSFEVGEPRLEIEESVARDGTRRRLVAPRGRWRVALVDCRFELAFEGETEATDEHGASTIARAAERLSGQALTVVAGHGDELQLDFDLGATLRIWRHPQSEPGAVLWELSGPEETHLFRS